MRQEREEKEMSDKEAVRILREVMAAFNKARAAWVAYFGDDEGFSVWFSSQVQGKSR